MARQMVRGKISEGLNLFLSPFTYLIYTLAH
jgi:hypothetical protein